MDQFLKKRCLISVKSLYISDLLMSVSASTLVSPSQTEIAKACAVVDSAGMVMVQEKESQEIQGVTRSQEPGEETSESRLRRIVLTFCQ